MDEEYNLELGDPELAARLRLELKRVGRTSLLAVADAVGSRDDLVYVEHLVEAHLAYDRALSPGATGAWVSGRARYDRFVPDHVLRTVDRAQSKR